MSEYLQNDNFKQQKLKLIIKSLHEGKAVDAVKKGFASLIKNVSPEEISAMENALIQEGFPPEQIQKLCEVHVDIRIPSTCQAILFILTYWKII
jgi:DUF438 domain-containing protein